MAIPATHRLSQTTFTALCGGGGGPATIRQLRAAQRSKTILAIGAVVALAEETRHPHRTLTADAYALLRELEADRPAAVGAALDYPSVGAWALRTAHALHRGDHTGAEPAWLGAVAATAAVRAGATARLSVQPRQRGHLPLPSLGVCTALDPAAPVEFVSGSDGAELRTGHRRIKVGADPQWSAVPWLRAAHGELAVDLRFDHLDADDAPAPAGADPRTAAAWAERVNPAWQVLVDRHHPVAVEFAEAISVLAPLTDPPAGTVSATGRHAFGAIAMSTPASPRSVAVTFAHELQHAKLSAVMDLFPLVSGDPGGRHYAPWRPDPRPLIGLVHGVYAHLAIADFWRRELRTPDGELSLVAFEFVRWRDAVRDTAARLAGNDRLTDLGRRLIHGVLAEVDGWQAEVPAGAAARARAAAADHRDRWVRAHGPIS
ncbi:HEXXH motif-containing putative peptide modification protein [Asanoa sp. WMMD1127]|uniref:aKG-HExxH-type peptide beta-hydroxylase n=1 Tax=Asanoa sp. WMMD1127 TaxID=3016107 RepID=UPI002417DEA6|nr:HEXXH motif-containing putative peptide modification protein [Asanoa sp. WMMD1127]MDG4821731.1 HEXXH motif-containing putative peptide modification protein [Asanoa sp. WMMD1127]